MKKSTFHINSDWVVSGLLFGSFLLLYLFTTNQIFSFDAITNAIACETNHPVRWFHPNHPLYPSLGVFWYRLERIFGYNNFAVYSLARLNSFFMALALGYLYLVLRRFVSRWKSVVGVCFLGSTYAIWHYAVDGRAVGLSVFFSVWVIALLAQVTHNRDVEGSLIPLCFASSFLILSHAIAVFHIIPVFLFLTKVRSKIKPVNTALIYLVFVLGFLLGVYLFIYYSVIYGVQQTSFFSWALGYGAFEGATHVFRSGFWGNGVVEILRGLWIGWSNALVNSLDPVGRGLKTVFSFLSLVVLAGVVLSVRFRNQTSQENKLLVRCLFLWGGLVTLFLAFWSPGQEGFRLHVLVPWFVGAVILARGSDAYFKRAAVLASILFVTNFSLGLYPAAFIQNNKGFQILKELRAHLKPGDMILSAQSGVFPKIEVLGPYFFPEIKTGTISGRLFAFKESDIEPLKKDLNRILKKGQKVYLAQDVFNTTTQLNLEEKFHLPSNSLKDLLRFYRIKGRIRLSTGIEISEVIEKR